MISVGDSAARASCPLGAEAVGGAVPDASGLGGVVDDIAGPVAGGAINGGVVTNSAGGADAVATTGVIECRVTDSVSDSDADLPSLILLADGVSAAATAVGRVGWA